MKEAGGSSDLYLCVCVYCLLATVYMFTGSMLLRALVDSMLNGRANWKYQKVNLLVRSLWNKSCYYNLANRICGVVLLVVVVVVVVSQNEHKIIAH